MSEPDAQPSDFSAREEFFFDDIKQMVQVIKLVAAGWVQLIEAVIGWILVSILLSVLRVPLAPLIALIPVIIVLGALGAVRFRKIMSLAVNSGIFIAVDPTGVTHHDEHATRFVAWPDLVHADTVTPIKGYQSNQSGPLMSLEAKKAADSDTSPVTQHPPGSVGLIGYGHIELDDGASSTIRTMYEQNADTFGHDEAGRPYVGLMMNVVGDNWTQDRVGQWVHHYRPDIFQQAQDSIAQPKATT